MPLGRGHPLILKHPPVARVVALPLPHLVQREHQVRLASTQEVHRRLLAAAVPEVIIVPGPVIDHQNSRPLGHALAQALGFEAAHQARIVLVFPLGSDEVTKALITEVQG